MNKAFPPSGEPEGGFDWNWLNPLYWFSEGMQKINDMTPQLRQNMAKAGIPDFGISTSVGFGGDVNYKAIYRGQEVFNTEYIDRSNADAKVNQEIAEVNGRYGNEWRGLNQSYFNSPIALPWGAGLSESISAVGAVSLRLLGVASIAVTLTGDTRQNNDIQYFYHYTDKAGLAGILSTNVILPNSKGKVYLTDQAFSPSEAFQNLFLMQKTHTGRGDYVISFGLTAFRVTEQVSEKYFEAGFGTNATPKHSETTQETTQEEVNTTQKIILKALKDKPETTQTELAKLIGISIDGIKYHIQKMTKEGIIKHEGSTKAGKWIILSE